MELDSLMKFNEEQLESAIIILLAENDYPPVDRDEVYKEIFEQAENFKRHQKA
jgi:type I restriction enzyme R subunit